MDDLVKFFEHYSDMEWTAWATLDWHNGLSAIVFDGNFGRLLGAGPAPPFGGHLGRHLPERLCLQTAFDDNPGGKVGGRVSLALKRHSRRFACGRAQKNAEE